MKITYSVLTNEGLIEAHRAGMIMDDWTDARLHFLPQIGYIARDEHGKIQGVGCVAWIGRGKSGKAVGAFSITDAFRRERAAGLVLRRAIEVIELALMTTPKIFAVPDPDIERSRPFMKRLGFIEEGREWVCYGAGYSNDHLSGDGRGVVCTDEISNADGNGGRAPAS
jgi:RimJ/RimL family protein N-acetyltransferase